MSILIKKFRIKSFKEERPAIELRDVTISYGTRQIVEKLNLSIQKSEISVVYWVQMELGKVQFTTLLWFDKTNLWKIFIDGEDATNVPTHLRCSKFGISWVPQYGGPGQISVHTIT